MSENTYAIVFDGEILEGFDLNSVKQRIQKAFSMDESRLEALFSGNTVVLQKGLGQFSAQRHGEMLEKIGMKVRVIASALESQDSGEAPPADTPPTELELEETDGLRPLNFEFSAKGAEYFRIWIVNLLLTIVTLGIYSAWAKVRTNRYFYANTRLDGSAFEYLASPITILKGRLIAFALLLGYVLVAQFAPIYEPAMILALVLVMPFLVVKALAFRARMSAYRNIRFDFSGSVGKGYLYFLLLPIVGVLSFGLLFPYAIYRQNRFMVEESGYGTSPFAFGAGAWDYYKVLLKAFGILILFVILFAVITPMMAIDMSTLAPGEEGGPPSPSMMLPLILMGVIFAALYQALLVYVKVNFINIKYGNTTLATHSLGASFHTGSYLWLIFSNTLAMVLTLGLFYPWAKVRKARYTAEHLMFIADGGLNAFVADQAKQVNAVGQEVGDVFDFDIGL